MILTFETSKFGLDIFMDAEGRDLLVAELAALEETDDHSHLMMQPGGEISARRYRDDSSSIDTVTIHTLRADAEPVALEQTIAHRYLPDRIERVEYLDGVEQSAAIDEKLMKRVADMKQHESYRNAFEAGWRSGMYNSIFSAGCVRFGEFKLKSGIMSPVYCDLRMLVSAPAVLAEIGKALGEKAKEIGCDRVAGIPYGGVPIAVAASIASGIPMIYPRKEVKDHGTRKAIEGTYNEGEKVLVIDDLVTSGLSFAEAVEPIKAAGLIVEDVLVILDREQGGAKVIEKAGYKLHALGTLSGMVDALVAAGKIEPEMKAKVAEFVANNQFA